ncbi:flavodoxin [Bilophila wadsworthia]|uniref:flavodoxin n=1 Tax=Bilophila wadsworthia TaxID=35833 RepID=UPI003C6C3938
MDKYNIIFVGYPNWFKTAPMAMFTFLEQFKFAGKTIVPSQHTAETGLPTAPRHCQRMPAGH